MTAHHDRHLPSGNRMHSADDYEREAEQTRLRLAENLDELSERLTPGQVFDEMLTYAGAGRGTFMRSFSNAVRSNPIPSLLVGVGCMLFLSEKMGYPRSGLTGRRDERDDGAEGVDLRGATGSGSGLKKGAVSAARTVADAAISVASSAKGYARGVGASVADSARDGSAAVSNAIDAGASMAGDALSNATDSVRTKAHDLSDSAAGAASIAADPLRQGASGLAGAAQEYSAENRLMGETSDSVKDTVGQVAGNQLEKSKRAAADLARHAAEQANSAADAARQEVTKAVQEATGPPNKPGDNGNGRDQRPSAETAASSSMESTRSG